MSKRVTSIRMTKAQERQIEALIELGYGNTTTVITTAVDRMCQQEHKGENEMSKSEREQVIEKWDELEVGPLTPEEQAGMPVEDIEAMTSKLKAAIETYEDECKAEYLRDLNIADRAEAERDEAWKENIDDSRVFDLMESICKPYTDKFWDSRKQSGLKNMTAREFYEKYLTDDMSLEEALDELSSYTEKAGYFRQFPDANLTLGNDQDDFVDFADEFIEWLKS